MKVCDSSIDEIREKLLIAMTKMAAQGSVPAAQAAVKMLDELEIRGISNRLDELKGNPSELCYYIGKIGALISDAERYLEREATQEEEDQFNRGSEDRRLEIKAVELEMVKRGKGKVENWMKR